MEEALNFWEQSYADGWFVRFSVIDKSSGAAAGTVELFKRSSSDNFNGVGVLRLDLGSTYEDEETIYCILSLTVPPAYELFGCESIITKGFPEACDRIRALEKYGFVKSEDKLTGEDGTEYSDYYIQIRKE